MLSVALLLASPGLMIQNCNRIKFRLIARGGNKLSQNRKWLGLCDFYEGIKDAASTQSGA